MGRVADNTAYPAEAPVPMPDREDLARIGATTDAKQLRRFVELADERMDAQALLPSATDSDLRYASGFRAGLKYLWKQIDMAQRAPATEGKEVKQDVSDPDDYTGR